MYPRSQISLLRLKLNLVCWWVIVALYLANTGKGEFSLVFLFVFISVFVSVFLSVFVFESLEDEDEDESIVGVRVNAPFLWVGSHALPL